LCHKCKMVCFSLNGRDIVKSKLELSTRTLRCYVVLWLFCAI